MSYELDEFLNDAMTEHLHYEYRDLLEDVKYTFEEETNPSELPRDLREALEEINLEWVLENHIECCGYEDEIWEGVTEWVCYHADCDEIICDYGIIRAIEDHYERGDSESDLAYKILQEEGVEYYDSDIYNAIYDDAVDYIISNLTDWFMEFVTVDANDIKSLAILCDKHDIDYVYCKEGGIEDIAIHTYDSNNNSRSVVFRFQSGYRNTIIVNGLTMFYDHVTIDDEGAKNYDRLMMWSDTESLLGTLKVSEGDEE